MNTADKQFTLLLVDDNPTNLTLLVKIIELDLPQVRVLTASNANDGLQLAKQERVDGAFIDVQMPEVSGLEMCRRLKADQRTAGMLLVLITAHLASPEMRAEGLEVGAYDFISQPISNVEMLARIKVMLRLCQGERAQRKHHQEQPQTADSIRLRWLNGLLLSGQGTVSDAEQRLLRDLADGLSTTAELDEVLLLEQLVGSFPPAWQRTFLKLGLFADMPLGLAGKLSEIANVEAVFDYLQRHDLIVTPANTAEDIFSFKPAAAEFLQRQAALLLPLKERQQICGLAADWYQQKKNPVAALNCLIQAEQYAAVSQLLSQCNLSLLADRCQAQVATLLAQVPEEIAVGCGWLALYTGVVYLQSQPQEVDSWLELARTRFVASDDQRGELLVLSQQLVQYLVVDGQSELGLERLFRLRQLSAHQLDQLEPFSRLKVLLAQGIGELFCAGDMGACAKVLDRALSEALREKIVEAQLEFSLLQLMHALYQGRFRVARASMELASLASVELSQNCLSVAVARVSACGMLYASGDLNSLYRHYDLARQNWQGQSLQGSACGPLLDFYFCLGKLAQGDQSVAAEQLDVALVASPAMDRPHLRSWLLQLRGLLLAQAGRVAEAEADCETGLQLRERIDGGFNGLPNLLLAGATAAVLERYPLAVDRLQLGLTTSLKLGDERYRAGFYAWLARVYSAMGEDTLALDQLAQLFELLRRQRIDFFFALTPDLIRRLLPLAATVPDWSQQLQQLAQRWLDCGLSGAGRLVPLARLQTFGCFRFSLQGKSCDLSEVGQSSRQLLALLAVAPNCSLSSELLMGTLWPESPASKARNSFDTALSRLRKALENVFGKQIRQDYLILEKGMLLLRNLRIDSVEFARLLDLSRRSLQRHNFWQAEQLFWQADRLWQGEFLAGFELDADLPYQRDHLRQLRLEQLDSLASLLLQQGSQTEALKKLQAGLVFEPTHDGLVRKMLDIYQLQNDKRAVRLLLDNYRKALEEEEYEPEEIDELITTLGPQRLEF